MNLGNSHLRPDRGPGFLAEVAARHLASGSRLDLSSAPGIHVALPRKALVQIRGIDPCLGSESLTLGGGEFAGHGLHGSDSLTEVKRFAKAEVIDGYASELLETFRMETGSERRKRKLKDLCDKHGRLAVATKAHVNPVALEQILKGVLLPEKADGTRSPRSLGDVAARAIEDAYGLGEGWFDAPDAEPILGDEAMAIALSYERMTPAEKRRLRLLMQAAIEGVEPPRAPTPPRSHPRGTSILGGLDAPPIVTKKKAQR